MRCAEISATNASRECKTVPRRRYRTGYFSTAGMIHEGACRDKHCLGLVFRAERRESVRRRTEVALSGAEGGGQVDERGPGWGYTDEIFSSCIGDIVRGAL